jgi:hypothetical protein
LVAVREFYSSGFEGLLNHDNGCSARFAFSGFELTESNDPDPGSLG